MPASDHKVTQLAFFFRSRALRVWNISIILAARSLGNLFRAFASISGCDPVDALAAITLHADHLETELTHS